jgi:hypothetical protein
MTTKAVEPAFIRDPGDLVTRCICPHDGTWMHVSTRGFWECAWGEPGAWKLMKTYKPKSARTMANLRRG